MNSIGLPAGLTAIGNGAFFGCTSLRSITLLALKPPALDGMVGTNGFIYVPAIALEAYKNGAGWKNYGDRIRAAGS
ncbi:MAG: leucine-rich repeat domain-containing protein [Treponema sp.]|nr:leucine-rich repeat domain-containing protein [Treponema sp.]